MAELGEVRAGQYFVIVDTSVPGGKMVGRKLYHGTNEADAEAEKLHRKGREVQVIDAVWYDPARRILKAQGMLGTSRGSDPVEQRMAAMVRVLKQTRRGEYVEEDDPGYRAAVRAGYVTRDGEVTDDGEFFLERERSHQSYAGETWQARSKARQRIRARGTGSAAYDRLQEAPPPLRQAVVDRLGPEEAVALAKEAAAEGDASLLTLIARSAGETARTMDTRAGSDGAKYKHASRIASKALDQWHGRLRKGFKRKGTNGGLGATGQKHGADFRRFRAAATKTIARLEKRLEGGAGAARCALGLQDIGDAYGEMGRAWAHVYSGAYSTKQWTRSMELGDLYMRLERVQQRFERQCLRAQRLDPKIRARKKRRYA
jgi:hypothetical protein